jgi:hypothetical protein
MLLDALTVAVLAFVGARIATLASTAVRSEVLRRRWLFIVRGLRLRHFLLAPVVLVGVVLVMVLLLQIPGMDWGWWTAIGGNGNVIIGSSSRAPGFWGRVLPLVFLVVLLPLLPLLAEREERLFRLGAESWSTGRRVRRSVEFGLVHLVMGIPIGVALALSVGGLYFTWAYLRGYREGGGDPEAGVAESTRAHLAYNLVVLGLAFVALVSMP